MINVEGVKDEKNMLSNEVICILHEILAKITSSGVPCIIGTQTTGIDGMRVTWATIKWGKGYSDHSHPLLWSLVSDVDLKGQVQGINGRGKKEIIYSYFFAQFNACQLEMGSWSIRHVSYENTI